MVNLPTPGTDLLAALHDEYVQRVNAALDEGRADLARELSDGYPDEALQLLTDVAPTR